MKHAMKLARALGLVCLASAASAAEKPLASATLEAADFPRADTPLSAELGAAAGAGLFAIWEVRPGQPDLPAAHQSDPANPNKIWWIAEGETAAGATRKFEIRPAPRAEEAPAALELKDTSRALVVAAGGQELLQYNYELVAPPSGVDPAFARGGYIHPMRALSGRLVTEDHPHDHLHHKGVWFPWTHTKFEGREVDFWNLGDKKGTVRFAGFEKKFAGPVFTGFIARHEHVDLSAPGGEKVALNEIWDVRVWRVPKRPEGQGYYVWDLVSTQTCASASPLELLEYRYGGLGFRGAKEWKDDNYLARASNGKTHKDGHTTRAKWCDHAGKVEGQPCGVLILGHPENFRFPEPMRLWDKGGAFFCWAPVQLGPAAIEPGKPHVSRYRFIVRDGEMSVEECERLWREFAEPPRVTVSAAE